MRCSLLILSFPVHFHLFALYLKESFNCLTNLIVSCLSYFKLKQVPSVLKAIDIKIPVFCFWQEAINGKFKESTQLQSYISFIATQCIKAIQESIRPIESVQNGKVWNEFEIASWRNIGCFGTISFKVAWRRKTETRGESDGLKKHKHLKGIRKVKTKYLFKRTKTSFAFIFGIYIGMCSDQR